MIEVEKKFRPTQEQLDSMLKDAEFIEEIVNNDIYYDYQDFRLSKKNIHLRERNGTFELKYKNKSNRENTEGVGVSEEIEDIKGIENFLEVSNLQDFIEKNLIKISEYKTIRKKYKSGEFFIDVDKLDFGYECVEIELIIENQSEIEEAVSKIIKFAENYNFEMKKMPSKRKEYFRIVKPEIYKSLFG